VHEAVFVKIFIRYAQYQKIGKSSSGTLNIKRLENQII